MWRACGPPARLAVLACALLLLLAAPAHAAPNNTNGICPSLDIRNTAEQFNKLKGCRVIEGQLSIVLMERATPKIYENMSFPELREVTGYVLIYRTKGVRNLGDLLPNLTVVRGMELFKDFALVIFDNAHLEALGLRSLMAVQRGGVRIERNDRLCYVNTIDWSRINSDDAENIIRANYDTRFCGLCPHPQSRIEDHPQSLMQYPTDTSGRLLCWDENHSQKVCLARCGQHGCLNNGTCCHSSCLGGCSGITAHDCYVCRNFSFGYGDKRVCVDSCPNGTYELFSRCVTEQECRSMPPPPPSTSHPMGEANYHRFASKLRVYKIHQNKKCEYICPSGYMEEGDERNATCVPCTASGGCVRECVAGKIDSVATAEQYKGCTHLKGKLEISIRAGGGNTLAALEKSLGEIRQITGILQVTRSYPLVSLMFFKSLKKIVGDKKSEYKGQVLHVLNNPNLELLWDWKEHGPIEISGGTIYIHLNPKLCYNQLLPLKNMTSDPRSNFTDIEVSEDSNGNQASCLPDYLDLKVSQLCDQVAVLTWKPYCPEDIRKLLGYSVYYIATEVNVTLYDQRDACSDVWNVLDIGAGDSSTRNTTEDTKTAALFNMCNEQQRFSPLSHLIPYTRYAAYVKTYTTLQDKRGAQSSIIYFRTLPGRPSPPQSLTVDHLGPHAVYIQWAPPTMANGTIMLYHVEVQANSYNRDQILDGRHSKDTCSNPSALANLIASRVEGAQETINEKVTEDVNNGTCACSAETKPSGTRFNVRAEEERMDSIHFENDLQNWVYKKNSERSIKVKSVARTKRSAEKSLNKMIVKMQNYTSPKPGLNYSNSTDGDNYAKSLYYNLDGKTHSVTVKQMRHFTWYTVNVWACRERAQNESKVAYDELWCSERAFYTFLTPELPNADVVSNVRRMPLGSSNKTNDVTVTWEPPSNPNGFVIAYSVRYTKIQEGSNAALSNCITADEFDPSRGHVIRSLNPGNYSIKVTPITARGPGNASADFYVDIPAMDQPASYDWVWGVVCGCLVILLVLITGVIWYVKRGFLSPTEAHKLFASVNPEYVSTVYVPDEWEVPRANIEFIRELGQGSFGMVYEGIAKNIEKGKPETRCAVKTVNEHATDRERIEFLNEASVMKAFDTFHVVRLLGVVSRGQPTLVVMELMELGDLKSYLRSHRPDADGSLPKKDGNDPPTLQNILQMAVEIADGMAYLSAKKFVHRDLAARNCMVAGDLTVKVGDFGMTRDIYETDYYRKGTKGLLPVRWMSPESLKDGVFSSNSDAWSYGVVLWEMATLAMQPYQGLSNEQVVRYVVEGGVMERPEHCPDRLYELMRACWAHRPAARPAFLHLVAELAPSAHPHFRHRSFFHSPLGQEMYALQRTALEEEQEATEVNVGAVATGSGSNLFGVSGRLASWVRELSSLRSRASDDAAAEPLQPLAPALKGPNGVLRDAAP